MIVYKKKEETIKPREPFWAFFCVFSLRSIFKAIFGFYQFAFLPYLSYFISRPLVLITNPFIHSFIHSLTLSLSHSHSPFLSLALSFTPCLSIILHPGPVPLSPLRCGRRMPVEVWEVGFPGVNPLAAVMSPEWHRSCHMPRSPPSRARILYLCYRDAVHQRAHSGQLINYDGVDTYLIFFNLKVFITSPGVNNAGLAVKKLPRPTAPLRDCLPRGCLFIPRVCLPQCLHVLTVVVAVLTCTL